MGVIKRVLYRGNILSKPRFKNLFLDMEENIHIHFRDLRIELSRAEFEEFTATFVRQSGELQGIIEAKKYQDGRLPNTNQEDVRIWTESRLKHEVKYHPQRFSLEECGDGYHFHYRNYKLLLSPDEFRQIARLFSTVDVDGGYAANYEEVLGLLEANDIDFGFANGNVPGETLAIAVARYHLPKVRDIFKYIGFAASTEGAVKVYSSERLVVRVTAHRRTDSLEFRRLRGIAGATRLAEYLSQEGAGIDPDALNRIKCQVVDLHFALLNGRGLTVEIDPQLWLHGAEGTGVIFPYSPVSRGGKADADRLYLDWSALLAQLGLGFVKPRKQRYASTQQDSVARQVDEALRREVAAFAAASRIYIMGSAIRGELGCYQVPFVHGKMAKLGSDIDILIEIDPAREADLPPSWRLVNPAASNHCAVYHVGEIPTAQDTGEWSRTFPNMKFVPHLIDAYVHFPSRGFVEEKDAFLKRFGARVFYDRARDGSVFADDETMHVHSALVEGWDLGGEVTVEPMKVSTENALFKVYAAGVCRILKLFKVSGNYSSSRLAEHTEYETGLIQQLRERGVPTAGIIPSRSGPCTRVLDRPAVLFERMEGEAQQRPEYRIDEIAAALAKIHKVQAGHPLDLGQAFPFDETCMIWLPAFDRYLRQSWDEAPIAEALDALAGIVQWHHSGANRGPMFERSVTVHCHGDVCPKNVMLTPGQASFFDFNNAFFGPRMADVIDGAFEFALAEKFIHLADFKRFDAFIEAYSAEYPLGDGEREDLPRWIELVGIMKFAKELRVVQQRPRNEQLRRKRALAIAGYLLKGRQASAG